MRGKWVLWDVCLDVEAGDLLAVFGRSGSGKTALARVIAGLDEQSSGEIILGEEDDAREPSITLGLSEPTLAPELTVYEILSLFARMWDVPRRKRGKEIAFLIELLKLGDVRSARTSALSSGELRRLEIARALIAGADITIFDSLLDGLDREVFEKLWDHLLSIRRDGRRAVIVMTASDRVAENCSRMAVIHRGRMCFVGQPDDFRRIAGEDLVVLGEITNPHVRDRVSEQLNVVIQQDQGFISFKVTNGERVVGDLLAEFGSDLNCVYLKRPTLEDALQVLESGGAGVVAGVSERWQ